MAEPGLVSPICADALDDRPRRGLARRPLMIGLIGAAVSLGAAAPAFAADGPFGLVHPAHPVAHTASKTVVMHRRVLAPGTYRVTIALSSSSARANHISVEVGSVALFVTTARRHRQATLSARVAVKGRSITIRAVGSRLRPRLSVRLRRVALRVAPELPVSADTPAEGSSSATTTAGPTTTTAGATGATGAAGATTGTGTTTPPSTPPPAPAPTPTPTPAPAPPVVPPSAPAPTPIGDPGSWHLVFDDEFNGSSLNLAAWSNGLWGFDGPLDPSELECYPASQVTESGGSLALTAIQKTASCSISGGSISEPYQSGMISTQKSFNFAYGFIEARAYLPGNGEVADWPGIWAAGNPPLPQDGELDVMEGLSGMACWHYHDSNGDRPGGCPSGTWTGAWHTFAADWEPGKVTWYYDGKAVGTDTQDIASAPEHLILNLAVDTTYGGPIETPASMLLDYIRVWQH
jgi:hypothetical protein